MIVQFALYPVLLLYLASTFCYLGTLASGRKSLEKSGYYALLAGFGLHVLAIAVRYGAEGYTPITSIHESLSFFALCIAGFFIFLRRAYRIEILGSIFLPVLSVIVIVTLSFPTQIKPLSPTLEGSYWLPIHTSFAFLGNAISLRGFSYRSSTSSSRGGSRGRSYAGDIRALPFPRDPRPHQLQMHVVRLSLFSRSA